MPEKEALRARITTAITKHSGPSFSDGTPGDSGGLRCPCGEFFPPAVSGLRPWPDYYDHFTDRLVEAAAGDADTWTVIGFWDDDDPFPVGVVAGEHDVLGGNRAVKEFNGPWAVCVDANTPADAELKASILQSRTLKSD